MDRYKFTISSVCDCDGVTNQPMEHLPMIERLGNIGGITDKPLQ